MIVCICRAKTDRDVLEAIEEGASSLRDLQRCGIGNDCGSCHNMLQVKLQTAAAGSAVARPLAPLPLSAEHAQ